jgi:hypothetical protein
MIFAPHPLWNSRQPQIELSLDVTRETWGCPLKRSIIMSKALRCGRQVVYITDDKAKSYFGILRKCLDSDKDDSFLVSRVQSVFT